MLAAGRTGHDRGAAIWLVWTRWAAVLNGHPAMLVTTIVCGFLGVIAVVWAIASLAIGARYDAYVDDDDSDTGPVAGPGPTANVEPGAGRRWRSGADHLCDPDRRDGLGPAVPGRRRSPWRRCGRRRRAGHRPADLVRDDAKLARNAKGEPVRPTVGLVFVPGARVDPRAYAHILRPLAEAGYLVAVLKEPFGLALPNRDQPTA